MTPEVQSCEILDVIARLDVADSCRTADHAKFKRKNSLPGLSLVGASSRIWYSFSVMLEV